jgi:hypothetical protein
VRRSPVDEISPELALVDPELAAEARASLPDPKPLARDRPVERPAALELPAPAPQGSRRSRGRDVLSVTASLGALILALALAAYVVIRPQDDPATAASPAQPPASPAPEPPAAPAQQQPQPQPSAAARPKPQPAPPPASRRKATPAPPPPTANVLGAKKVKPPAPPTARRRKASPRPPADIQRVFIWAPAKGALYYRVEFLRNGKPFHAAQTADASLRLPATLKLPPGTYRWSVRPATVGEAGVVLRRAILTRSFRVGRG